MPTNAPRVKTFVIDSNVLIHDPQSLFKFQEHNVIVPVEVLEELDNLKSEQHTERGRNAREVNRTFDQLFGNSKSVNLGVVLPGGGKLMIFTVAPEKFKTKNPRLRLTLRDEKKKDNLILRSAWAIHETYPAPVIVVSKDTNVRLKARAIGLEAEDYLHDRVQHEAESNGHTLRLDITPHDLQRYASEGMIDIPADAGFYENQYVLLHADGHTMPGRLARKQIHRLSHPEHIKLLGGIPIRPRNLEQQFLLDALLDPKISMVTVTGQAGSGKTLLSLLAALHQVLNVRTYDKAVISRVLMDLGNGSQQLGFLPGSIDEKMAPWLQPYFDALDLIFPAKKVDEKFQEKQKKKIDVGSLPPQPRSSVYDKLVQAGLLQIEALTYIRGRSIPRSFIVVDESQNISFHEIRTIATRMSEGSKLVLIGDPSQIDAPYLDSFSNGLVYADTKLRGQSFFASIHLTKGERSELAEAAARIL